MRISGLRQMDDDIESDSMDNVRSKLLSRSMADEEAFYGIGDDDDFYEHILDERQAETDMVNQEIIDSLREELSRVSLDFQDDGSWDDVVYGHDANRVPFIRKCAVFQSAHFCATTDRQHKDLRLNLKVGKHKFHRAAATAARLALEDSVEDSMESDAAQSAGQQQEDWVVASSVMDVADDEWNDESLWKSAATTFQSKQFGHRGLIRKCRGTALCLCQYVDAAFDGQQKHQCLSSTQRRHAMLDAMDHFLSTPLLPPPPPSHQNVGADIKDSHGAMPLKVEEERPLSPSIVHLQIMSHFPHFHRRHHLHRYRIPWWKYRKYGHLRPNHRPKWCPRWIWREVVAHLRRPPGFRRNVQSRGKDADAVSAMDGDYYEYDENAMDRIESALTEDDDHFDDELPFMVPLIQATSNLLPNVLRNARQVLPKVLKKEVDKGNIDRKLKRRGGPEMFGKMPREIKHRKRPVLRRMMMDAVDVIDSWFDHETASDWVVVAGDITSDWSGIDDEAMSWNMERQDIVTANGKDLSRKCSNLFGRQFCVCQFVEMVGVKPNEHLCFPSKAAAKGTAKGAATKSGPTRREFEKKTVAHSEEQRAEKLNDRKIRAIEREDLSQKERNGLKRQKERERMGVAIEAGFHRRIEALRQMEEERDHQRLQTPPKPKAKGKGVQKELGPATIRKMEAAQSERRKAAAKRKRVKEDATKQLETAERNIVAEEAMNIRKRVKGLLPETRPKWLPFYFWHWILHSPHFHALRHRRRRHWTPPAAPQHVKVDSARAMEYSDDHRIAEGEYDGFIGMDDEQSSNEDPAVFAAEMEDDSLWAGDWSDYDGAVGDEWSAVDEYRYFDDQQYDERESVRDEVGNGMENALSGEDEMFETQFVWMIGMVAVTVFIVFACCASIGASRREQHYDFVSSEDAHSPRPRSKEISESESCSDREDLVGARMHDV